MEVAQDGQAKANRARAGMPWYRKPAPIWGLGVAAAAVGGTLLTAAAWRAYADDPAPKRWKSVAEYSSSCYENLNTSAPAPSRDCFHSEGAAIPAQSFDWLKTHAAVYSIAAPPRAAATLRDLGDRGQAEAIDFLELDSALKGRSWTDLQDALNESSIAVGERDPFRFDRVLVATVAKGLDWRPGDRMEWSRVLIEPINFFFAGYTVAATDNETVKVSSIEATSARKFSADIAATIPGLEGPKASVGPSSEHSIKTTSDINAQYEKLGIDIMPNFLRIIRESETGGDVVGNTTVSLTAVTDAQSIRKQFPSDKSSSAYPGDETVLLVTGTHFDKRDQGKPSGDQPGQANLIDVLPQAPVPHCALRARVWMLYEERRVDSGRESYDESKQAVTLVHDAEDKQDVDIVSADEVSPAVWSIKICNPAKCDGDDPDSTPLQAKFGGVGQWRKVVFTDYGVAVKVVHWLRTTPPDRRSETEYTFSYPGPKGDQNAQPDNMEGLVLVKKTADECKVRSNEHLTSR